MSDLFFDDFFCTATGFEKPFEYQCRLACGPAASLQRRQFLKNGTECKSQLINVPTGLGKTAAVVLAWLWNRVLCSDEGRRVSWPRRLVYCLPMRTLVEQTRGNVSQWLIRLAYAAAPDDGVVAKAVNELSPTARELLETERTKLRLQTTKLMRAKEKLFWLLEHSPIVLMGGEELDDARRNWDLYPEKPAILIGTQDMLLSRALNRGYGMTRYRWPMHFGLLNNDCLWVLDETQLIGPGLSTACQLEAFRRANAEESKPQGFGAYGDAGSVTWYMSATSNREHLNTREWRGVTRPGDFEFSLDAQEKATTDGPIAQRRLAVKRLQAERTWNFENPRNSDAVVAEILKIHEEMLRAVTSKPELPARTLIICNTVDHAVSVHSLLAAKAPKSCDLLLLHSRFRPPERRDQMKRLTFPDLAVFAKGQIVVSTQVIEAGVDVSSAILCSEIAPLASLVQRLGRVNRSGEFNGSPWKPTALIVGVGVEEAPTRESKDAQKNRVRENLKRCLPYDLTACEAAWNSLQKLNDDASPANFGDIQDDIAASIARCPYSLQRHELGDFFDTDANLSLGFTDVSPFVRGLDEDTDVHVLWRENWIQEDSQDGMGKPRFTANFQRDEICSIPISRARAALGIVNQGWLWRGKESGWISVRDSGVAPGMTILLPMSAGGYSQEVGWTGNPTDNKHRSYYQPQADPSDEDLLSCLEHGWRSIDAHTGEVAEELAKLLDELLPGAGNKSERDALRSAVPWHDIGKNHPAWQQEVLKALETAGIEGNDEHRPFAKFSLSDSPQLVENGQRLTGQALKAKVKELRRSFRPGFTHEVASALAFRDAEQKQFGPARDTELPSLLAEYVIMSHHGRVRRVLRDEIPKFPKKENDTDTVRGVENGTAIPPVTINGQTFFCESLSNDCRRMGRDADGHESYTRAVLRLLDWYGPFRLAFFEALIRAADMRASAQANQDQRL
jgi:CRISPR-associated endonuclease/helicase Cas3